MPGNKRWPKILCGFSKRGQLEYNQAGVCQVLKTEQGAGCGSRSHKKLHEMIFARSLGILADCVGYGEISLDIAGYRCMRLSDCNNGMRSSKFLRTNARTASIVKGIRVGFGGLGEVRYRVISCMYSSSIMLSMYNDLLNGRGLEYTSIALCR